MSWEISRWRKQQNIWGYYTLFETSYIYSDIPIWSVANSLARTSSIKVWNSMKKIVSRKYWTLTKSAFLKFKDFFNVYHFSAWPHAMMWVKYGNHNGVVNIYQSTKWCEMVQPRNVVIIYAVACSFSYACMRAYP